MFVGLRMLRTQLLEQFTYRDHVTQTRIVTSVTPMENGRNRDRQGQRVRTIYRAGFRDRLACRHAALDVGGGTDALTRRQRWLAREVTGIERDLGGVEVALANPERCVDRLHPRGHPDLAWNLF